MSDSNLRYSTPTNSKEAINDDSGSKKKKNKSSKKGKKNKINDGDLQPSRTASDPQVKSNLSLNLKSSMVSNGPGGSDLETLPAAAVTITTAPSTADTVGGGYILNPDIPLPQDDPDSITNNIQLSTSDDNIRHWKHNLSRSYGYSSLFRFASPVDKIYLILGMITAIIGGLCLPLMIYIFGNMVRSMVLVSKIQHSFECDSGKYSDNTLLGDRESCKKFEATCLADKPFGGHKLDEAFLNQKTFESMKNQFVLWHVIAAAVFTVCSSIYFICWHTAADNQISRMRRKYFEALLRKDLAWFDIQKDPDAVNKVMDHTRRVLEGIGENIPIAINLFVIFVVSMIMAFCHGWELSFLGVISVALLVVTSWLVSYTEARKVVAEQRAYKIGSELADEVLTNSRIVTFYGGQKKELIRYKKELKRDFGTVMKWIVLHSGCVFLFWFSNFVVWAIIFWYGIALAILSKDCRESSYYSDYDAGDVIIIILSMIFGAGNIYLVVPVIQSMRVGRDYGRKVLKVIDGPSGIDNMDSEGIKLDNLEPLQGNIEFDDVRFTYPNRKGETVLNHLHMSITAGNKVAIVGVNGCGKSTVIKLICKEYLPDSGFIRIDGMDIRTINTEWLRSQIGVVPQDANLFDDTIEANVKMGKLNAEFFEIQEACKSANAHNFIVSLKEAYQTKIGQYGCRLTAGQQQRIAIARALIRNPRILLLDEPTSSLDADSEITVMETLEKVSKDRTVVVVAHRLHTITNADQIYVMKRGKVAEKGIHANLVKNKGPYGQLASGLIDKPSNSIKEPAQIKSFDLTEITTIYFMKLFAVKPFSPNLYNNLMSVNPVASQVSYKLVKETHASEGGHVFNDIEDGYYTLEGKDSLATGDTQLSKSEENFKDRNPEKNVVLESVQVVKPEVEGLTDLLNPNQYSFWQVFWLATGSFYKMLLLVVVIASVFLGLILPIFGILLAEVIGVLSDASAVPGNWKLAKQLGMDNYYKWIIIGFAFLGLGAGIAAAFQEFALSLGSYRMIMYVRKKLFGAFLKQNLAFFENPLNSVSRMMTMLSNNVDALRYIISGFYATLIQCTVTVAFSILIAGAVYGGTLAGYTIVISIAVTLINFLDGWLAKKQLVTNMKALTEISGLILQVFRGKHNVTILQLEPYFLEKFNDIQMVSLRKRRRISYARAITFGFAQTAVFWGYSLFIFLGANEIVYSGYRFMDVIAIGELLLFGFITLGTNLSTMPSFAEAVNAGELLLNVLNRKPDISNFTGDDLTDCTGKLAFHDAHFWYPYSGDNPLLKGITFTVPAGKTIGIVGSSESGKSVYLDLVMRLYDVTSGAITLDGRDIKDVNVLSLRQCIGYVEKQPELFQRTVAENIAYGDNTGVLNMKRIIEAAEMTSMHDFIVSLPDGYETRIGGDKDRLTTAQKQRITVARALLRDPKVLLIDEATSSLDREGEKLMIESIEAARKGRTCIIIAHRLLTIQKADMIIMMNDGYNTEMGSHADLLKIPNGVYGKLWRSQNPLEDDAFAKGKNCVNNSTPPPPPPQKPKVEELKTVDPPLPPPPPPPPPPAKPEAIPEEKKDVKSGGWKWGLPCGGPST